MSEIQHPGMELEASTFLCPHCNAEIASANQLTHEVACARMHRNGNQRAPVAQRIERQSSSGAVTDQSNNQPRVQAAPRREERRVAENKLIACPNCEKSVREQDINNHLDNECLKNEMIPCEFCEDSITMSDYSQHVESCPRRPQNQQNVNRDRSPVRERPNPERVMEEEPAYLEEESSDRDRSPEHGSSQQGGFRGFFRNLASTAASAYRTYNEQVQREAEERQQQREEQQQRQQEMLRHMFGQPQVARNPFSNQSALVPYVRPNNGGSRVIRTVERGPGGSVIVRSRVVPSEQPQMFQRMPNHPMPINSMGGMGGMDPMEMLFGLLNGRMGGMYAIGNGEMGNVAPEQTGLNKETINSLALVKYSAEANKNVDEESKKCPICLEQFEEGQDVRFLWCTHRFHKNCVDQWLDSHTNCPICKKDFSEAEQSYSP